MARINDENFSILYCKAIFTARVKMKIMVDGIIERATLCAPFLCAPFKVFWWISFQMNWSLFNSQFEFHIVNTFFVFSMDGNYMWSNKEEIYFQLFSLDFFILLDLDVHRFLSVTKWLQWICYHIHPKSWHKPKVVVKAAMKTQFQSFFFSLNDENLIIPLLLSLGIVEKHTRVFHIYS